MRQERGAALVEMALTLVLLLFLVSGIADVGRLLFTNIGVQDAAQEGVAFDAFNRGDVASTKARTVSATDYPSLSESDVQVVCTGSRVSVTVSHDVELMTPLIRNLLGETRTLSRTFTSDVFDTEGCA